MSNYSKLKQLAEAADHQMPSPWFVHRDGMGSEFPPNPEQNFGIDDSRGWAVAWHGVGRNSGIWLEEAAEFMAAANPAAVRALLAENEALRRALQAITTQVDENIRPTVRDCVNGQSNVQDIYGYCDQIESIAAAAMKEPQP